MLYYNKGKAGVLGHIVEKLMDGLHASGGSANTNDIMIVFGGRRGASGVTFLFSDLHVVKIGAVQGIFKIKDLR